MDRSANIWKDNLSWFWVIWKKESRQVCMISLTKVLQLYKAQKRNIWGWGSIKVPTKISNLFLTTLNSTVCIFYSIRILIKLNHLFSVDSKNINSALKITGKRIITKYSKKLKHFQKESKIFATRATSHTTNSMTYS